jgi:hypothetical protein
MSNKRFRLPEIDIVTTGVLVCGVTALVLIAANIIIELDAAKDV